MQPKASAKLATTVKQVSYANIPIYMSDIPEHKIAMTLTF